jgi:hypothetical protein
LGGKSWWIVIGVNDTIETVYAGGKSGKGDRIVTAGRLYDLVELINAELT